MRTKWMRTAVTSSSSPASTASCICARGPTEMPRGERSISPRKRWIGSTTTIERDQQEPEQEARHELDRRQREHVVAHVAAEHRIGDAEGRSVRGLKQRAPLRRPRPARTSTARNPSLAAPASRVRARAARALRRGDPRPAERVTPETGPVTLGATERDARIAVQHGERHDRRRRCRAPIGRRSS